MPLPQRIRQPFLLVFLGTLLIVLTIAAVTAGAWAQLNSPLNLEQPVRFDVPAGASLASISDRLAARGWLQQPRVFTAWARLSGNAARIQAGEYELSASLTPRQLLDKLVNGDVTSYQLTLVEGWTFRQALEQIWNSPGIRVTLAGQSDAAIADGLGLPHDNPEGLLFPDTYFYPAGTADREILLRAYRRLDTILNDSWAQRAVGLPVDSAYQALILASIVEKETGVAGERGRIAGVFARRLQLGMRLQSDPTVIYGMGSRYQGNIDRAALREETPYNTYRINGLPPTPIALAGREAIAASVNPEVTDALYFVARGDGSHQFSSTLEEHNAAVRRYQLNQDAQ